MRNQRRNKQTLHYSNFSNEEPVYVLDSNGNKIVDFVDDDGTTYYLVTGETHKAYSLPSVMEANVAMSGGRAKTVEYGIDDSAYDLSVVYELKKYPIDETTLVWYESEPIIVDGVVDEKSADYKVVKIKNSLNETKLLLSKLVK